MDTTINDNSNDSEFNDMPPLIPVSDRFNILNHTITPNNSVANIIEMKQILEKNHRICIVALTSN